MPEVQSDFNHIKSQLVEIKTELKSHYPNREKVQDDQFYEVMQPFIETAEMHFAAAEAAMSQMNELFKDCVKYYGENPAVMKPDEFFGIFKTFMSSFEV